MFGSFEGDKQFEAQFIADWQIRLMESYLNHPDLRQLIALATGDDPYAPEALAMLPENIQDTITDLNAFDPAFAPSAVLNAIRSAGAQSAPNLNK